MSPVGLGATYPLAGTTGSLPGTGLTTEQSLTKES
jgi:hypothetical protein